MANFVSVTPLFKDDVADTAAFNANTNEVFRFQAAPVSLPAKYSGVVSMVQIKEQKGNGKRLVTYYSTQAVSALVTAFGASFIAIQPVAADLAPNTSPFYQNIADIAKIKAPGTLDVAKFSTATSAIIIKEPKDNYLAVVTYLSAQLVADLVTAAG